MRIIGKILAVPAITAVTILKWFSAFCGSMTGNFFVKDTLSLKSGCKVDGDLHVKRLQVELDACFNGSCHMIDEAEFDRLSGETADAQ